MFPGPLTNGAFKSVRVILIKDVISLDWISVSWKLNDRRESSYRWWFEVSVVMLDSFGVRSLPIFCDNLGNIVVLIDHESGSKFLNTFLAGLDSLLQSHVFMESIVKNWIDEVASVALGTFVNLLEGTKIVHPIKLGSSFNMIISSHKKVNLVRTLS